MPPKANLNATARAAVAASGLSRNGKVKVVAAALFDMPPLAPVFRADRCVSPPGCFYFSYFLTDGGMAWSVSYVVNDAGWPNRLVVVDVIFCGRPIPRQGRQP